MDINSLLDSLTDDDIEKLKQTAQQFMGGVPSVDTPEKAGVRKESPFDAIDPNMISAVSKVAGAMNKPDPRCDFIASLKPLLSPERGKKADDAVMMLKFMKIIESMKGLFP